MISIKRFIDANTEETLQALLHAYREALAAIGDGGVRACPAVGANLRQGLNNVQQQLSGDLTPSLVVTTGSEVEQEIGRWGESAADYFNQRTNEVKEIMLVLARTAEALGQRDQHYSSQFQEFTGQLRAIASLQDLNRMRSSLLESATALKSCTEKMAQDSQQTLVRLSQEVNKYQVRLDDAEREATSDPLTGLENRRKVERAIQVRIENNRTFSILIIDLNGFKQINDGLGHLVGDEVLKKFAEELKSVFRAVDVVGRWGGDEFIVVLDASSSEAALHSMRVRKWVFGSYTLGAKNSGCQVQVDGAIGVATSRPDDTYATLVERADAAMYENKRAAKAAAAAKKAAEDRAATGGARDGR